MAITDNNEVKGEGLCVVGVRGYCDFPLRVGRIAMDIPDGSFETDVRGQVEVMRIIVEVF